MNKLSAASQMLFELFETAKDRQSCDWLYGSGDGIGSKVELSRHHPGFGLRLARKRGHSLSRKETQRPEVNAKVWQIVVMIVWFFVSKIQGVQNV